MSVVDESCELGGTAEELVQGFDVEPGRRFGTPDGRVVAAERPLRSVVADACGDRVPNDVEDRRSEIPIARHLAGERTIAEEVRDPLMPAIRPSRVRPVHQLET